MIRMGHNKPLTWILWHPHQGLWNRTLLGFIKKVAPLSIIYRLVALTIILIDTVILFVRSLVRRILTLGLRSLIGITRVPSNLQVLYIDLGTHKEAEELFLMVNKILPRMCENFEAYGFEASREFATQAAAKFAEDQKVHIVNKALCYALPRNGTIKLYRGPGDGLNSSIYRNNFKKYEEVKTMRLSDWLRENNLDLEKSICLLRMNIEGAEGDVIRDLVESGFAEHIDGYYGMWDDLSKINIEHDKEFREFLADNHIYPFTFNGRDLRFGFRIKCIEYDIHTSVMAGLERIKKDRIETINKNDRINA